MVLIPHHSYAFTDLDAVGGPVTIVMMLDPDHGAQTVVDVFTHVGDGWVEPQDILWYVGAEWKAYEANFVRNSSDLNFHVPVFCDECEDDYHVLNAIMMIEEV